MAIYLFMKQLCASFMQFVRYLLTRIVHDRLTVTAGSLAYVTLLSLVPCLTVILTVFSSFPAFSDFSILIQDFVIEHFVPAAGQVVKEYLNQFTANAGRMTAVGLLALLVVAMLLISAIDRALNYIFRVESKRRRAISFSIYWMILTLGPILVGSSLTISTYLGSLTLIGSELATGALQRTLRLLPALMSMAAFVGLYLLVPNRKVIFMHALSGGVVATLLFEISKKGFALYLSYFPTYQVIYGALAAVPILFVWVYLSWCVVLLGAELTAALGEPWRGLQDEKQPAMITTDEVKEKQNDSVDSAGK
ncbi:virulence factor BrkB family protein [Thaumasiovibrio sp. DFM-14]|uniref:virulence factor BrkB family protein n=1 Tax=Thaumasiovibrio sp. DFM-14 TaxID=3384792 RepID=UPI0039A399B9